MVVKCFTTFLNRPLQKWGIWRPRFLQLWFSVGTILSILLLPVAIFLLVRSFITELMQKTSSDEPSSIILEPVVRICHDVFVLYLIYRALIHALLIFINILISDPRLQLTFQ